MLHRLLFLLCFPILCLRGDAPESSSNNHLGPIPEWVKPCDFALEAPLKPSQEHIQNLLTDVQRNWENKTTFIHGVVKIINQVIIESLSQLRFSFDPTYQQVIVHQIRVFRNGQWNDRIMTSRHNLIQREEELDQQLFSGNFTHVYFLNDIRVGDILEYSLSSIGENPVFSSHLTDIQFLQSTVAEEKSYYRLLIHPDRSFAIKPCNTSIEPSITDLSPTL
ncbi:MAG TPA: DUF3857 domain-containing protein, partial [Rhabdochlamydiaceae bacterium]|nr:DUF3857 domain-containing protein [Rhabdochlamydiaceae bacterium]